MIREIPVLAVLHTADLFHDPRMKAPTLRDWSKIRAFRAGTWPKPLPEKRLWKGPVDMVVPFAPYVVIDTEYRAPNGVKWDDPGFRRQDAILDLVGVGWPTDHGDVVVQCLWARGDSAAERSFAHWLREFVSAVPVVFQNAQADMPLLQANLGIEYGDYSRIDDLMLAHGVLWSEWPHDLEFLASVYSLYPKTKHLAKTDPLLYNRGDVADTIRCWDAIEAELAADPLSKGIYQNQSLPMLPILLRRQAAGIKTNQEKIEQAIAVLSTEQQAATRLAQAYTGVPGFNLGSPIQLQRWLYDVEGLPVQINKKTKQRTIEDEAMVALRSTFDPVPDFEEEQVSPLTYVQAEERVGAGAHPLLEARVIYAGAQQSISHYLRPMLGRSRVYPHYALHAQASGRWSITNPPLQQFPRVPKEAVAGHIARLIEASLEPDPGEVWIGWDWKQIEPRLEAYLSGEPRLIELFEAGGDPYRLYAQLMGWENPTDEQRQFAKRHRLKLSYGGSERSDTPGRAALGLSREELARAGASIIRGLPRLGAYWKRLQAQAVSTRKVRTFNGRLRALLGKTGKAMREALNHPNQGGVADILNLTIIRIHAALPDALVVFTVHDAAWIGVPIGKYEEALSTIKEIVTAPWEINGRAVRFPADFKERWSSPRPSFTT
jgi:DNA polymerase I-like protein with 3'-5' exonuclease and polymerase domains